VIENGRVKTTELFGREKREEEGEEICGEVIKQQRVAFRTIPEEFHLKNFYRELVSPTHLVEQTTHSALTVWQFETRTTTEKENVFKKRELWVIPQPLPPLTRGDSW
jgi:hypothetical protein